jgi:hypothetical protein
MFPVRPISREAYSYQNAPVEGPQNKIEEKTGVIAKMVEKSGLKKGYVSLDAKFATAPDAPANRTIYN